MTKEAALALAAKGFKVFPIAQGKKAPPMLVNWPQRASSDAETVAMIWLTCPPEANIGIHCEGMVVIDCDVKNGGNDALAFLDMAEGLAVYSYRSHSHLAGGIFFIACLLVMPAYRTVSSLSARALTSGAQAGM
jgi:L-alanine-DL-glutamate epimerase-like enolase superfamily enzyme